MNSTKYNLEILATAWNRLDVQILESRISEIFSYESQFVFKEIKSKSEFLLHLNSKFKAIRFLKESGEMTVFAEIGHHPSLIMQPCIILTQIVDENVDKVLLYIEEAEDLISSINVCFIPDPFTAVISVIQPN